MLSIDRTFDSVLLGGGSLLARFPSRVNDEGLRRISGAYLISEGTSFFEACLVEFPQVEGGCNRVTANKLVL